MINDGLTKKKLPFAAHKDSGEFQRKVYLLLIKEFAERQTKHVSAENLLVFQHGGKWNFQRQEKDGFNPHSGQLELQSSTVSIELDRVLKNDATLISDFIYKMANSMEGKLFSGIIKEMGETAQETGNTFSIPKEGMTGEAFLEMIQRTEVHVGSDGKVSRPSLYLAPDVFEKMKLNLEKLGPEFEKKVDALWLEKETQALQQEAARLARYDLVE